MDGPRQVSPRTQKTRPAGAGWASHTDRIVTRHFRPGLSDQQVAKLRDMFDVLDGDNSGTCFVLLNVLLPVVFFVRIVPLTLSFSFTFSPRHD